MSTPVFHRRRAERFAQLLDSTGGPRRHARSHARSRAEDELTEMVGVGHRLARVDFGIKADPEFRDGLRAMLMATIEREGIGATAVADATGSERRQATRRTGPRFAPAGTRRARGAMVVGLTVGTLAVSGMSAASGDAIPGDTLYRVKRSTERAQLALASSDVGRGQLYLEFAKTRMNEAAAVRNDATGLAAVLDDMDAETRQGVKLLNTAAIDRRDPAALDAVDAFVVPQRHTLSGLLAGRTGEARARTLDSLFLLDQIKRRSSGLRSSLRCGDIASVRVDTLGPLPRLCAARGPVQPITPDATNPNTTTGSGSTTGTGSTTGGVVAPPASTGAVGPPVDVGPPSPPSKPEDSKPSKQGLLDQLGRLLGGAFK